MNRWLIISEMYRWIISLGNLILFINVIIFHCDKQTTKNLCYIHTHDLTWNGLDMCSKLWSKCLPFRASLSAILSAFSWHFCLVGLSVYSYPGLEAHVCDGLSGWKNTYHASITYYSWFVGFGFWTLVLSVCIHGSIGHWFIVLVHRVGLWPLLLTFAL